ncbi:MAG: DUF2846 domain-containing protein [Burkholderiales bacterium]
MDINRLLLIGALAILSGCATGMKHAEMKSQIPAVKSDEGRVYFFRSASMFGAAIQPDIRLNGVVVGSSKPGGFFFIDRGPGSYEANASTELERKLTFTLDVGETKYVRTSPSFGVLVGRINFALVNRPEAETEMESLSYTGAPAVK